MINSTIDKRDVKLQIFVTSKVDDRLQDLAELMGMTKNELVRQAIGQYLLGYEKSIDFMREKFANDDSITLPYV